MLQPTHRHNDSDLSDVHASMNLRAKNGKLALLTLPDTSDLLAMVVSVPYTCDTSCGPQRCGKGLTTDSPGFNQSTGITACFWY